MLKLLCDVEEHAQGRVLFVQVRFSFTTKVTNAFPAPSLRCVYTLNEIKRRDLFRQSALSGPDEVTHVRHTVHTHRQ